MDIISSQHLWKFIKQINQSGTTIIIVSHIMEDLENICTRIAILRNKKIMEIGTPAELSIIYSRQYEIKIETTHKKYAQLTKILKTKTDKITKAVLRNNQLVITTPKPEIAAEIPAIIQKCNDTLKTLQASKPTLKEIFIRLVHKKDEEPANTKK